MTPQDIITAIRTAGAMITTDGLKITITPRVAVQPMVMDEARRQKPALIAHLLLSRLEKGLALLWGLERRGQVGTPAYVQGHTLFINLLCAYELACDAIGREVAA